MLEYYGCLGAGLPGYVLSSESCPPRKPITTGGKSPRLVRRGGGANGYLCNLWEQLR